MLLKDNEICFAKTREDAIIPTKSKENMGYDIYPCFNGEGAVIPAHTTVIIPTGIASACNEKYGFLLQERGSTGTKGMALRCGVIDSGYRGEWFVPITNTTDHDIVICKDDKAFWDSDVFVYPYTKAICQAIIVEVPVMKVLETPYADLQTIESERKMGKLGSSNK